MEVQIKKNKLLEDLLECDQHEYLVYQYKFYNGRTTLHLIFMELQLVKQSSLCGCMIIISIELILRLMAWSTENCLKRLKGTTLNILKRNASCYYDRNCGFIRQMTLSLHAQIEGNIQNLKNSCNSSGFTYETLTGSRFKESKLCDVALAVLNAFAAFGGGIRADSESNLTLSELQALGSTAGVLLPPLPALPLWHCCNILSSSEKSGKATTKRSESPSSLILEPIEDVSESLSSLSKPDKEETTELAEERPEFDVGVRGHCGLKKASRMRPISSIISRRGISNGFRYDLADACRARKSNGDFIKPVKGVKFRLAASVLLAARLSYINRAKYVENAYCRKILKSETSLYHIGQWIFSSSLVLGIAPLCLLLLCPNLIVIK
uniref:Uncharacterized protein n=1 Tax=Glossina brevipalpis TaxID=37001 RepID=A0A1A9WCJ3_9MUSC